MIWGLIQIYFLANETSCTMRQTKERCAQGTSDTRCPRIDVVLPQNIDLLMA